MQTLTKITDNYEIILVDDGSTDNSAEKIIAATKINNNVKGVLLAENYGQHIAIKAGLDNCSGEWVVVMDCDLQDRPEEIIPLMEMANNGFDAVFASRIKRNDTILKKCYSAAFYFVLKIITGTNINGSTANFGVYKGTIIQQLRNKKYRHFFFPVAIRNVTKNAAYCPVDHGIRALGSTTYSFKKALLLAIRIIMNESLLKLFYPKKMVAYQVKQKINFTNDPI